MVEFFVVIIESNWFSDSCGSSCQAHLPMSGTSSRGGLKATRRVRQQPSQAGSASKLSKPSGRCCPTSAPNISTINLLKVEWTLFAGLISHTGKCMADFSLNKTCSLFVLLRLITTINLSRSLTWGMAAGKIFLCHAFLVECSLYS